MRAKIFGQGLLLTLAILTMAGAVRAAPVASSKVKALPAYQRAGTFKIEYVATASEGSVSRVDLYASKDLGPYGLVGTVNDGTTPFTFTTDGRGDGYYAFYTVATLSTGESESTKLPTSEADTNVDTITPSTLDVSRLSINLEPSLVSGEVTGASGAVEAGARVEMYADAAMTALLRWTRATSTGSFGPMTVGGSTVRAVWLAARDAAGNRGAGIQLDNNLTYGASLTSFTLMADGGNAIIANFVAPASTKQFRVQYRHAGGAVWSVDYMDVGTNGTTIRLTGLEAGRAYDVRVAPVDANRNIGFYSMGAVRTAGPKVDTVVLPSEVVKVASSTTTTTPAATSTSAATEPAKAAAVESETKTDVTTPANTNDANAANAADNAPAETNAEVTNAETTATTATEQSGSATPWVILAILIVLAGIATGGYFYWFSGPEEVTTAVTPNDEKKADKEKASETEEDDEDKRW